MDINTEQFRKIKEEAERFYKEISEIYCPYFQETISFNAKGLDHIKFSEWNKARPIKQQYMRLRLLKLAPQVIKKSHTLQEFHETKRFERQKINSRWEKRTVMVRYYGFIAITDNLRTKVKIIIKEIERGKRFFWSIIPFWKAKKNEFNNQYKKILHNGDLETQ
ncbi:MAG: hypothetical protein COX44_02215 [Candidatus Portnoybacteria bacterium CG23_combo_of_CG06-09_8_20_14_all_37_13]|uniref:Large polyvalent protein-associated domain-containing protein n=1 Tax=Candidatus Portnoybacteria bacterium CG23_combo_of_CG06-09_8_20_14_all_37_13 TaxID=1974819 RepID=A0A2G9YCW4_9BACT|nr:MAG: hypothetical protein COX44_02215 [Candidatus Portnoybacteria bacterium CG23_combo_of_CG06-09_8_20_14_all_37_13]